MYRLHCFPESGNSYKIALMLALCGQPFETMWTDFGAGVTRTPEWRAEVNEMGEIPVLEADGERLSQTAVILTKLAEWHGRFGGSEPRDRDEILRWLFWDNHKFSSYAATYRFLRTFTENPEPHVLEFLRKRVESGLRILDRRLGERRFTIGDAPTIADISIAAYLSYPNEETGFDLPATHPVLQSWLDRIAALPGWRAPYELLPGKRLVSYI